MNKDKRQKMNKKKREKVEWDDTISDLKAHKASAEDVLERKLSHQSKHQTLHFNSQNIETNQTESVYDRLTKTRYGNKIKMDEASQRKDILKNMFIPDKELFELFSQSEKALSNVEDMFGDHKRRYRATPTVTLAPNENNFSKSLNNSNSCALNDLSNSEDEITSSQTEDRSNEDDLTKFRKFIEKEKKINDTLHNKLEEKRSVLLGITESMKKCDVSTETEQTTHKNEILTYIDSRLENHPYDDTDIFEEDKILVNRIINHFEVLEKEKTEEISSLRAELCGSKELIDALTLELINNDEQMRRIKTDSDMFMKNVTAELSQIKSYIIKYFDQRQLNVTSEPFSTNEKHFNLADHLFKENFNLGKTTNNIRNEDHSLTEQIKQLQISHQQTQKRLNSLMKVQHSITKISENCD